MSWEAVIGLEIHAQLATHSKIFSGAATAYGAPPNTQACAVDLGLPGVLPVMNAEAVRLAVRFGLAVNARIARTSIFARKNYFYPDLPKGYQISKYEHPVVAAGVIDVPRDDGSVFAVRITRAHLEEDAGKSLHEDFHGMSGIDLNRAGTPLLEIVSEPDMRCAADAVAYMREIHTLVRFLDVCDGNMQEGSFRCDANVSVRRSGESEFGTRTEIKNLNSFRFVERAIEFEIKRHIEVLEGGSSIVQETRQYDADRDVTRTMRTKEDADDYRYFPDPDLLPLHVADDLIASERSSLPELPNARCRRYVETLGVPRGDAVTLSRERAVAEYFELAVGGSADHGRATANWITGELFAYLNRHETAIQSAAVTPAMLAALITRIEDGTVSGTMAKEVFEAMWNGEGDADQIIEARGLRQVSDTSELNACVEQIITANPDQVEQYRAGKEKVLAFLVGQVMKLTRGRADPRRVNELMRDKLQGGG